MNSDTERQFKQQTICSGFFLWLTGVTVHIIFAFLSVDCCHSGGVTDLFQDGVSCMTLSLMAIVSFSYLVFGSSSIFSNVYPKICPKCTNPRCIFTLASCESRVKPGNGRPSGFLHRSDGSQAEQQLMQPPKTHAAYKMPPQDRHYCSASSAHHPSQSSPPS